MKHSSVGRALAPCVETTVLTAGDPGSLFPVFLSLSTNLYIKGKKPKNILKKKKLIQQCSTRTVNITIKGLKKLLSKPTNQQF